MTRIAGRWRLVGLLAFLVLCLSSVSARAGVVPEDPSWIYFGPAMVTGIASGGDLNGDGIDDLTAGMIDSFPPAIHVWFGSKSGLTEQPDVTIDQFSPFEGNIPFGLSTAGDINGDGYDDLVVTDSGYVYEPVGEPEGRFGQVALYLGGPDGPASFPSWTWEGEQPGARFGNSVDSGGDLNGDGFDDILVGAVRYSVGGPESREGAVFAFFGGPDGPGPMPDWTYLGTGAGEQLGLEVAILGDIDGDTYDDLAAASPFWQDEEGKVEVWLGGPAGPSSAPSHQLEASGSPPCGSGGWLFGGFEGLQRSIAKLGDVNDDGLADFAVGAPRCDLGGGEGAVWVYLGALSAEPVPQPPFSGEGSGDVIALGGDLDGDGRADLVSGSPVAWQGGADGQGVVRFYLSQGGVPSLHPGQPALTGSSKSDPFGLTTDISGDLNGDGFHDVVLTRGDYFANPRETVYVYYSCLPDSNGDQDPLCWGASTGDDDDSAGDDDDSAGDDDDSAGDDDDAAGDDDDGDGPPDPGGCGCGGCAQDDQDVPLAGVLLLPLLFLRRSRWRARTRVESP